MYYVPGVPNPYGLPMPKKRRGRRSDLSKFLERQGDLFLAALILARCGHNSERKDHAKHSD